MRILSVMVVALAMTACASVGGVVKPKAEKPAAVTETYPYAIAASGVYRQDGQCYYQANTRAGSVIRGRLDARTCDDLKVINDTLATQVEQAQRAKKAAVTPPPAPPKPEAEPKADN